MGKLKASRSMHRMARWKTSDSLAGAIRPAVRQAFHRDSCTPSSQNDEFEQYMDVSLAQVIKQIAKEQQEFIELNREEEGEDDEELLLRKTKSLAIGLNCNQGNLVSDVDGRINPYVMDFPEESDTVLSQFEPFINREAFPAMDEAVLEYKRKYKSNHDSLLLSPEQNPNVVQLYTKIGELLQCYRFGKLPKAFRIIASIPNWEEIIQLTKPEDWTHAAMLETVRLFVAYPKARLAQRFISLVLLEAVRRDIQKHGCLDPLLHQTLVLVIRNKPLYFLRGLILPLCQLGCTLFEASIIGELVLQQPIGRVQAAMCINQLALLPYIPAVSLFLQHLIPKAYSAHFRTADAVRYHFCRMKDDSRRMPVIWHQALLTFVQHFQRNLTDAGFVALLHLLESKWHPDISPKVRHILQDRLQLSKHTIPLPVAYSSESESESDSDSEGNSETLTTDDAVDEEAAVIDHDSDHDNDTDTDHNHGNTGSHLQEMEHTDTGSDMSVDN